MAKPKWRALLFISLIFLAKADAQEPLVIGFGQTPYDFTELFLRFTEKTGIPINSAPSENYDLKAELIKKGANKRLPDAFISPVDYITIDDSALLQLDNTWFDKDISLESKQLVRQGDAFLAVPIVAGNHLMMFYNKSLVSEPAKTWQELIQQQNTLIEDTRLLAWAFQGMYYYIPFLSAFDALPIKSGKLVLDSPEAIAALEFVWSLVEQGIIDPACSISCFESEFLQGKLAYLMDGIWNYQKFQNGLGENLGIALIPSIGNKPAKPYFSAHSFAVPKADLSQEKIAQIKALALFLQQETSQLSMWQSGKALPVNETALNAIKANASTNTLALIEQLQQAEPIPNSPYMNIVWEALIKGHRRYGAGILTASEATALMQYLAERTIERQNSE